MTTRPRAPASPTEPEVPPERWIAAVAPTTPAQRLAVGLLAYLLVALLCSAALVAVVILAPAP